MLPVTARLGSLRCADRRRASPTRSARSSARARTRASARGMWETPVRCTATVVALRACCTSARCVLQGFVSET
eukprot:1520412-Pleurochrysis_carterae.AAC.1